MKITVKTTEATYIFDNAIEVEFEVGNLYAHSIPAEEGKTGYRFEDTDYADYDTYSAANEEE